MDPQAAILAMCDAWRNEEYVEAYHHALDLSCWLDNGGFVPEQYSASELDCLCSDIMHQSALRLGLWHDELGATACEYSVMLSLLVLACIATVYVVGAQLDSLFRAVANVF